MLGIASCIHFAKLMQRTPFNVGKLPMREIFRQLSRASVRCRKIDKLMQRIAVKAQECYLMFEMSVRVSSLPGDDEP